MSRFMFSAILGLALSINVVAGTFAWHVAMYPTATGAVEVPDPAIGYAFYSALNQVLASGDRGALDTLVSDDFVDHLNGSGTDRSVDALVEQMTSIGEANPEATITVRDIAPADGGLVASIEPMNLGDIPIAGLSLHTHPSYGGYDVLSIRDGKVTERWSTPLPNVPAMAFPAATFSMDGTINTGQRLDRIRLKSGRIFEWTLQGPALLIVEAGSVQSDIVFEDGQKRTQHDKDRLDEGSVTLLAAGARIQLQREGDTPAQVLLYSTHQVAQTNDHPTDEPTGANTLRLSSSFLPLLQQGRWQISIAKLDLRNGESLDLGLPKGAILLLTSDVQVAAVAGHGTITTLGKESGVVKRPGSDTIAAGAAATITKTSELTLQATGSADGSVWVVTVEPTGTSGPLAGPKVD